MTEQEYKKLSLSFRQVASRLLNTNFQEANVNLERFLLFIEDTPIISSFIAENNTKKFDIESIVKAQDFYDKYELPVRVSDEIAFIYQLLNYIHNSGNRYVNFTYAYGSNKFQDKVDNFNNQVVKPLYDHIRIFLEGLAIDMGLDNKKSTQYNFNGDIRAMMLNHAEDHASITANQTYNETAVQELKEVSQKYLQALAAEESISAEDKEETVELVEAVLVEAESDKPKKVILRTAIEKIKTISEMATAGSAVFTLGQQLLPLVQHFSG